MASTDTVVETLAVALNEANPNSISDALKKVALGSVLAPIKKTVSQTAATTITLSPAALSVQSVRVTAGVAAAGVRTISDSGATASATVCKLSDDGATLTFEATLTDAVVVYVQRPATSLSSAFAPST